MKLLSVQAAQNRILRRVRPVEKEAVPLAVCAGRILAANIRSADLPRFDNSSVDGFAVIAADTAKSPRAPVRLRVVEDIPAGYISRLRLRPGQAARIMTGAPLPAGADAVVMLEDTDAGLRSRNPVPPTWVTARRRVRPAENVRRRGMDLERGRTVLGVGRSLQARELGMLAMLGLSFVKVFRRPKVALLSSGNELAPVGRMLKPGQIRDANSYSLGALIRDAGARLLPLGISSDNESDVRRRLARASRDRADLIVSSAGVSVGAFDVIRDVLTAEGRLDFWRVNVRPGKPLAFGDYEGIPFIGLPGNPVSAFVGFELFVRPCIARLAGMQKLVRRVELVTVAEVVESDGRESYLRCVIEQRGHNRFARLTGNQGSGNLLSLVQADALLIVPAGVKSLAVGDQAQAWML